MNTLEEINRVKQLGEEIGYGQLMSLVTALWRKSLKEKGYPIEGAFVPTCLPFIKKEIIKSTNLLQELATFDKLVE